MRRQWQPLRPLQSRCEYTVAHAFCIHDAESEARLVQGPSEASKPLVPAGCSAKKRCQRAAAERWQTDRRPPAYTRCGLRGRPTIPSNITDAVYVRWSCIDGGSRSNLRHRVANAHCAMLVCMDHAKLESRHCKTLQAQLPETHPGARVTALLPVWQGRRTSCQRTCGCANGFLATLTRSAGCLGSRWLRARFWRVKSCSLARRARRSSASSTTSRCRIVDCRGSMP